jgi:hypothetical protein
LSKAYTHQEGSCVPPRCPDRAWRARRRLWRRAAGPRSGPATSWSTSAVGTGGSSSARSSAVGGDVGGDVGVPGCRGGACRRSWRAYRARGRHSGVGSGGRRSTRFGAGRHSRTDGCSARGHRRTRASMRAGGAIRQSASPQGHRRPGSPCDGCAIQQGASPRAPAMFWHTRLGRLFDVRSVPRWRWIAAGMLGVARCTAWRRAFGWEAAGWVRFWRLSARLTRRGFVSCEGGAPLVWCGSRRRRGRMRLGRVDLAAGRLRRRRVRR